MATNNIKKEISAVELADIVGCDQSLISKLKGEGIIKVNDSKKFDSLPTLKLLFNYYRGKSGDIDLKSEKIVSEIKINDEQVEILKIKKERLRGSLVEFELIKLAFDEMSITLRNTILDSDAEITRLARTAENIDTAREIVRRKLTDCLKNLSELNAEDFDAITQEEIEETKPVALEKTND